MFYFKDQTSRIWINFRDLSNYFSHTEVGHYTCLSDSKLYETLEYVVPNLNLCNYFDKYSIDEIYISEDSIEQLILNFIEVVPAKHIIPLYIKYIDTIKLALKRTLITVDLSKSKIHKMTDGISIKIPDTIEYILVSSEYPSLTIIYNKKDSKWYLNGINDNKNLIPLTEAHKYISKEVLYKLSKFMSFIDLESKND